MTYHMVVKDDELSQNLANELKDKLQTIHFEWNEESPSIVFTIGGDGTMLKAVHHYMDQIEKVVFIGIHTGKLGFYTDFIPSEIDELIDYLKNDASYVDTPFPLLETEICEGDSCKTVYALNEITLINAKRTQHVDVLINDHYFESFQGTGLCVSTPSGSSAFNKSLGGALVHPQLMAFQLTEMASINNNVYRTISSPMVFPQGTKVSLKARDFNEVLLTVDHEHRPLKHYDQIHVRLSDKCVTIRQFRQNDFWQRIQKSFL